MIHRAMPLLAIETTCDETAAAIITRDRVVLSSVVASQDAPCAVAGRGAGGGLPGPRRTDHSGDRRGGDAGRHRPCRPRGRGRRRQARARRLAAGGSVGRQGDRRHARHSHRRLRPHRSPSLRLPARIPSRRPLSRVGLVASGGHTSLFLASVGRSISSGSAARSTTPPARPSTRRRACSASVIRADRRSNGRPLGGNPKAIGCRGRWPTTTKGSISASAA
jgi:hypothetical protein